MPLVEWLTLRDAVDMMMSYSVDFLQLDDGNYDVICCDAKFIKTANLVVSTA